MNHEALQLYELIKHFRLNWRHPELERAVRKIERGRMRPQQAKRWLRKIRPWVEQQEQCFNPFKAAPDQEELGKFDIELAVLSEKPTVRVGIRVLDRPRHIIVAGTTGSGKSNLLRKLINGLDAINRGTRRIHHDPGA